MQKRNALKTIAACALSISAAGLFSACSEKKAEFRGVDIQHADEMIWQSYQHGLRAVSVNGGTPAMAVPQVFKTLEALSA